MIQDKLILEDMQNFLTRLEVQTLELTKNIIDIQRRINNVLEKYEDK